MKILMISFQSLDEFAIGGVKGTKRNYNALSHYGSVDLYSIKKKSNFLSTLSLLENNIPPILNRDHKIILEKFNDEKYDYVFLDHSLLGSFAKELKKRYLKCRIITTYRNCEFDYIDVRFKKNQLFRKIIYKRLAKKAEAAATRYSDMRIVLSKRDQNRIFELYNVFPELIIPQTLDDVFNQADVLPETEHEKTVLLFGPAGTANLESFSWFVKNVSPFINATTLIAGKDMDKFKDILSNEHTKVIGFVEDIGKMYASVDCVVIPLKKGGGMKFKTAEALMFGKYVFGTKETFEGYDEDMSAFSKQCEDPDDFIKHINLFLQSNRRFYPEARECYINNYSTSESYKFFTKVFDRQA